MLKYELNEKQYEAVTTKEGPVLVVSGAGSGKTRVITYRQSYLIDSGVDPENILTVTFTNKAATEMKDRIKKLVDDQVGGRLNVSTFHSACVKILSKNLNKIGYDKNFLIYSRDESESLIKTITKDMNLSKEMYNPSDIQHIISRAKLDLIEPRDMIDVYGNNDYYRHVSTIYEKYEEQLVERNVFDFADLIVKTIALFEDNPLVLKNYQNKFKYIQVDEYQDTNHAQYKLIKMLSKPQDNILVVGDADQSIYGFRGANLENILNFQDDYEDVKVVRMGRNYRSTKNIIEASNSVIDNNTERLEKQAWTEKKAGKPVVVCESYNSFAESQFIAEMISTLKSNGYDYKDIAILYRVNFLSRQLEESLINYHIPYQIVSGLNFFDRKEIKNFMALIKLGLGLDDLTSFTRVVNFESNGIGEGAVLKLQNHAIDNGLSIIDILENPTTVKGIGKVKGEAITKVKNRFVDTVLDIINDDSIDSYKKVKAIYEQTYFEEILEQEENADERINNVEEFMNYIGEITKENDPGVANIINQIKLKFDQDELDEDDDTVKLMTVHAAKGLEFPAVFIAGMEEGLFPYELSIEEGDIEEERRLAYVAMTRAEEMLYMSHVSLRFKYGQFEEREPSRFIDEIPQRYSKNIKYYEDRSA